MDESEKEAKNARHPWMKVEKHWKSTFRHGGWVENSENIISAAAETEKTTKIDFRPWPKSRKQQKERFGRGRKTKNGENCISAMAESLKMKKLRFGHGRNWKNAENHISNPLEAEKQPQNGFPAIGKQKDWCLKRIHVLQWASEKENIAFLCFIHDFNVTLQS